MKCWPPAAGDGLCLKKTEKHTVVDYRNEIT